MVSYDDGSTFDLGSDVLVLEAKTPWGMPSDGGFGNTMQLKLKLKLSVLTLSQRLVTPRTPRVSGARLGVQPLQLPEIPIHYKWGPQ